MSRARGRHSGRIPTITPDSPQGRQIGLAEKPLPGGQTHLVNPPVKHQKPAVPDQRSEGFDGMLAHGVPPLHHGVYDRHVPGTKHGDYKPEYEKPAEQIVPVPVWVVESPRANRHVITVTKHVQVPVFGNEPVSICEDDGDRVAVYVMNEGIASGTGVRIGQLSDLTFDMANSLIVGGALLPNSMTNYLKLEGQSAIYIVSMDTHQPYVSVIIETEVAG